MKIVFMGTPDFALASLARLIGDGHALAGVFCQPDKPAGRGHQLSAPPVKRLAQKQGIPVYQPHSLRKGNAPEIIRALSPELIVVVAYGKILPPAVLEIPALGCLNVHGSLLPKYRGAAPIQRSILNGDTVTGVTTMYMAEGVDTGDILLQRETPIGENETAGELFDRLSELGAELLSETIGALQAGNLRPKQQEDALATYAAMLTKEMTPIDWTGSAAEVHHQVCGLSPWPCAETTLAGARLKIFRSEIVSDQNGIPGTLLSGREFTIACGSGALRLNEVQYEGGKRLSGGAFLRGRRLNPGERLGEC